MVRHSFTPGSNELRGIKYINWEQAWIHIIMVRDHTVPLDTILRCHPSKWCGGWTLLDSTRVKRYISPRKPYQAQDAGGLDKRDGNCPIPLSTTTRLKANSTIRYRTRFSSYNEGPHTNKTRTAWLKRAEILLSTQTLKKNKIERQPL